MSWSTQSTSPSTFPLVLAILLAYFGLCLGGRTVVLLRNFGIHYNSSSFLESYENMLDVDIDPSGEYDKKDTHPDKTGENIPLTKEGGVIGGSTWEPE